MGKFNSKWIERNMYLRPKSGTMPEDNHYERYERPVIVCLCGSTRFYAAFQEANYRETMAGRIVLSVGFYRPSPQSAGETVRHELHGENIGCTPEEKIALDVLHKEKIDLADEVLVLNVGGYIGDSTRSEVRHAFRTGKTIRWLEPDKIPADFA